MAGQTSSREPEQLGAGARPERIRIAAIMPVYNGSLWVEQALRSILAQTLAPDEIIVVDDGSTDDSMDLVRAIAVDRTDIRILTQENAGQSAARNHAISQCTSEWIALIDQDDIWYPNHLEVLVDSIRSHSGLRLGWVYSDFDDIDIDGRLVNRGYIGKTTIDNTFIPRPTSQWRIHASSAGGTERTEASLRIYLQKLIEAYPNDKWRGYYYRSDLIAPRFISIWLQMYIRASRFQNRVKMRLYAREAGALVRYLRPRTRVKTAAALFLLRQPLFIRIWAGTAERQSFGWSAMSAWGRRMTSL